VDRLYTGEEDFLHPPYLPQGVWDDRWEGEGSCSHWQCSGHKSHRQRAGQ
jgi:hypothetical protein